MTVERVISEKKDQFPIGMRVLAVDDDPTCLLLLETLLRRCQYNVTITSQAVTALKLLRENKNNFDLVISDVHMPDMDGFKLLELVGLEMDLPVIMLSANGDTKLVMKGITHGACDYLLKPVRIEELKRITCLANQQANMAAAVGSADSTYLRMGSLNGLGNFHTLAGSDQLRNAAFRSFPPGGVLGRLNTPAGLGMHGLPSPGMIQLNHVQNLGNTNNDQSKLQSFVIPGNHNANILQGMPMSLELDQLQNNKGVNHIGELSTADNSTVFPVSGSLINARTTGCSDNPLPGVTSNSLMLEGSSQQATLHASNLRDSVSAMGFKSGNPLSHFTSMAPASDQLQDSKADLQSQASPISNQMLCVVQ